MGKRILIGVMVLTLMLAITGCGSKSTMEGMRIQPAVLTPNEANLIQLINSSDQSSQIFEYNVDSNAKTVAITTYKLDDDGKWVTRFGPSSFAMQATTGRIAISFDNIDDGIGVAMQDNTGTIGSSVDPGQKSNLSEMARVSSFADIVDIEYDKEIPLAMQVFSAGGDMISGEMDTFYHPEKLLNSGYDEVFVVVIKFSKGGLQ